MKIAFLINEEDTHSQKWLRYFGQNHNVFAIKTRKYPWKLLEIANIFSVAKQIRETKPDVLHAHYAGVNGLLGAICNFKPFFVSAWGSDVMVSPKKNFLRRMAVKYIFKKADLITCDAEHMKREIAGYGVPDSKIKIINFGVDTRKFSPAQKNGDIQKKIGVAPSPVIISLRKLEEIYDIESLLLAAPAVLKKYKNAKFLIVGRGSKENSLKELAKSLKVSESVKFVGWLSQEDIANYLRQSDVYVSTSLSDGGIASSTAEAMACKLPVVITDFGDNKEWVRDGESGFLVPLKSPAVLADRIIKLLENPEMRKIMGEKGRKIIEEKDDYYKEMAKMEKLYQLYETA